METGGQIPALSNHTLCRFLGDLDFKQWYLSNNLSPLARDCLIFQLTSKSLHNKDLDEWMGGLRQWIFFSEIMALVGGCPETMDFSDGEIYSGAELTS